MKRTHYARKIVPPRVDLSKSLAAGLALLKKGRVPFALAGRLAVWEYVPAEAQMLTKLVREHLGPFGPARLDALARRIGHPGPGMAGRYRTRRTASSGRRT